MLNLLDAVKSALPAMIVAFPQQTAFVLLAESYAQQREWDQAEDNYVHAIDIARRAALPVREARNLRLYATTVLCPTGRTKDTRTALGRARHLSQADGDRRAAAEIEDLLNHLDREPTRRR